MEPKLYVGNLSYEATEEDLRQVFGEAGPVASASIITDRDTGRSKGFGFVEMTTQVDAEKAVSLLNGRELRGRPLKVDLARPRADRPSGGGMGRGGRGERRGPGGDRGDRRY
jgi:RNA recognition motif-containing protein